MPLGRGIPRLSGNANKQLHGDNVCQIRVDSQSCPRSSKSRLESNPSLSRIQKSRRNHPDLYRKKWNCIPVEFKH